MAKLVRSPTPTRLTLSGDFSAIIDWGDGSPNSVGTVTGSGGTFVVDGSHIYAAAGTFTPIITVTEVDGSLVKILGGVAVSDPTITGVGGSFSSVEGLPSGQVLLGVITDPNTLATAADISATVTSWGGTSTPIPPVTVVQTSSTAAGTVFDVFGDVIYKDEGVYTYTFTATSIGGATTGPITGTATVADARLTGTTGTEITGTEGISTGTVLLGSFTDADPTGSLADFTATVAWGGAGVGSTSATVTQPGGVGTPFLVSGAFAYNNVGTYGYTVTVVDDGGQSTLVSGSAIIADAPLTAIPTDLIVTSESPVYPVPEFGVPIFSGLVGSFSSTDPLLTASNFTATIDWGDGTPNSAATSITQVDGAGTAFDVFGVSHVRQLGSTGIHLPDHGVRDRDQR